MRDCGAGPLRSVSGSAAAAARDGSFQPKQGYCVLEGSPHTLAFI